MLQGAEGQAACTALAQALAACSSLQTLRLGGECGKGWEGKEVVMRDAPVSVCLLPHLYRTCVRVALRVCVHVCLSGWMCVCVACVPHAIFLYLSILVSTPFFIHPFVFRAHLCVVQRVGAARNSKTNHILPGPLGLLKE